MNWLRTRNNISIILRTGVFGRRGLKPFYIVVIIISVARVRCSGKQNASLVPTMANPSCFYRKQFSGNFSPCAMEKNVSYIISPPLKILLARATNVRHIERDRRTQCPTIFNATIKTLLFFLFLNRRHSRRSTIRQKRIIILILKCISV